MTNSDSFITSNGDTYTTGLRVNNQYFTLSYDSNTYEDHVWMARQVNNAIKAIQDQTKADIRTEFKYLLLSIASLLFLNGPLWVWAFHLKTNIAVGYFTCIVTFYLFYFYIVKSAARLYKSLN